MKISEMVDKLEDIAHKHGDVDVLHEIRAIYAPMYEPAHIAFDGVDVIIS